jgi:hypothetical protein
MEVVLDFGIGGRGVAAFGAPRGVGAPHWRRIGLVRLEEEMDGLGWT